MKNFIRPVFKITLLESLLIAGLAGIKYLIINTGFLDGDQIALAIVVLCALFLYVIAIGIARKIEDKWQSVENWKEKHGSSKFTFLFQEL